MKLRVLEQIEPIEGKAVRTACGYGCVRCGCNIVQYCELSHDTLAQNRFLACPECLKVLRGLVKDPPVLERVIKHPIAIQPEFNRKGLSYLGGMRLPDILLPGGIVLHSTPIPVVLSGYPILRVDMPEVSGGPFQLTLRLNGMDGQIFKIVDQNLWRGNDEWRFERIGDAYFIENAISADRINFGIHGGSEIEIYELQACEGERRLTINSSGIDVDGAPFIFQKTSDRMVGISA